jgi:uncharacterized protein (TIGR02145 family)
MVGDGLFLPAAGYRSYTHGTLNQRGNNGCYWTDNNYGGTYMYYLTFSGNGKPSMAYRDPSYAQSVRCVEK